MNTIKRITKSAISALNPKDTIRDDIVKGSRNGIKPPKPTPPTRDTIDVVRPEAAFD